MDFKTDENQLVVGTPEQPIVRVGTKNIIEAPEKSFKTTFALRFAIGLSCGQTVYQQLPIPNKALRVLYLHGELSGPEIQDRTRAACEGLPRPLETLFQGREISMHFIDAQGREAVKQPIREFKPEVVIFDPWQAFIAGLDENQFKDVSGALAFIDKLIQEFNITVFLVTHQGKDRTRGTRGHSCLACWRDTLIKLEREGKALKVKVTVEPRWAAPVEPFHLEFDRGTLWPSEHFTGRTEEIRAYLIEHGGTAKKQDIQDSLKFPTSDAYRKALQRGERSRAFSLRGEMVSLPEFREAERTTL